MVFMRLLLFGNLSVEYSRRYLSGPTEANIFNFEFETNAVDVPAGPAINTSFYKLIITSTYLQAIILDDNIFLKPNNKAITLRSNRLRIKFECFLATAKFIPNIVIMQIFLRQQLVPLPYLQFVPNSKHHFSRMSDLKIDATSGSDHSLKPEICSSEDIDVLAVASGEDFILEETDAFYVFKSGHIFTH